MEAFIETDQYHASILIYNIASEKVWPAFEIYFKCWSKINAYTKELFFSAKA